ncbi:MAG: metal-binding protein [Acidobacteria bacterium]|nr:metal-binding protein [Acidobacteriota bacterium]
MIRHTNVENDELRRLIAEGKIIYGGNARLKIYGRLTCLSGKRMFRKNRVFFADKDEAEANGFRPCGNCMKEEYRKWRERQA